MTNILRFVVSIAALAACLPASAEQVGKWQKAKVEGFDKYWTVNNLGSTFTIWCHPQRKTNGTLITISIDGHAPEPNSPVRIAVDNDLFKLPADDYGYIETGCATCADSFAYLWHRIRSSTTLAVKFHDDSYAGFSLNGANAVMPADVCPTDFAKKRQNG